MSFIRSGNPALSAKTFREAERTVQSTESMTIQGTVNKTALLTLMTFGSAIYTWQLYMASLDFAAIQPYVIGGVISAFVVAMIITFKKTTAPYLAPAYCLLKGLALGGISAFFETIYPGIVIQALLLTFGILFSLLFIYKMRLIRVTENFKLIVGAATAGIMLTYLFSFIGSFFGFSLPFIHEGGTFGIIFSLAVVVLASLNLVMDFDFIEEAEEMKAPKYMEWYAAFGLMVTLIWLYIELLRLLAKARRS